MKSLRVFLCLLVVVLPGCGLSGQGKTTVRFWNGFTGPDGRTMLGLVKRFNAENPDVRVLMQRMDWATYYNKLFVAGIGGRAPELFIVHTSAIERFMRARFIRPIDEYVKGAQGIPVDDIDANVWAAVEKQGMHYGLPLDVHLLGLYYNERLFRNAGIVDAQGRAKPPRNREEFLAAAEALTQDTDGDGRIDQWGYVFTWFRTNIFTYMCQWEGRMFSPGFGECLLDTPANVAALDFCTGLIQRYEVAPTPENFDSWVGFQQERVAMAFEGIYMLADIEKLGLEVNGAPLPVLGKEPAVWADSHTLCMCSDLDPLEADAAWRFMVFLSNNSLDWAEGGQVPVRKSLRESPRFKAMPIQRAFASQLPYIRYAPRVPFIFEFWTEFDAAAEKALRGSATAEEALTEAAARIDRIIQRYAENERLAGTSYP